MQCWKKRAETYLKGALGDLRDTPGDSNSVQGLQGQCFQHQQVESSTEKVSTFVLQAVLLSEYDKNRLTVSRNLQRARFSLSRSRASTLKRGGRHSGEAQRGFMRENAARPMLGHRQHIVESVIQPCRSGLFWMPAAWRTSGSEPTSGTWSVRWQDRQSNCYTLITPRPRCRNSPTCLPTSAQLPFTQARASRAGADWFYSAFLRRIDADLFHIPLNAVPLWMPKPYMVTIHDMSTLLFANEPGYQNSLRLLLLAPRIVARRSRNCGFQRHPPRRGLAPGYSGQPDPRSL